MSAECSPEAEINGFHVTPRNVLSGRGRSHNPVKLRVALDQDGPERTRNDFEADVMETAHFNTEFHGDSVNFVSKSPYCRQTPCESSAHLVHKHFTRLHAVRRGFSQVQTHTEICGVIVIINASNLLSSKITCIFDRSLALQLSTTE